MSEPRDLAAEAAAIRKRARHTINESIELMEALLTVTRGIALRVQLRLKHHTGAETERSQRLNQLACLLSEGQERIDEARAAWREIEHDSISDDHAGARVAAARAGLQDVATRVRALENRVNGA